jgi:hypothetical protein
MEEEEEEVGNANNNNSCWHDRWSSIKKKEIESDEILQFMDLERQLLLNDIKLMKILNSNSDNNSTSTDTTTSRTATKQQNQQHSQDDSYNKILLRLEESEYQKQIGFMIRNEQNKIKEIDSLEIELPKMAFVAVKLEQQRSQQQQQQQQKHQKEEEQQHQDTSDEEELEKRRRRRLEDVDGLRVQTQAHINELQVLRNNIQNHIEEQTIKVFGDGGRAKSAVVDTKKKEYKEKEEETVDAKIQRLESLLTKKNIELFTTKAELKVTKRKLSLASSVNSKNKSKNKSHSKSSSNSNISSKNIIIKSIGTADDKKCMLV